MSETQKPKRLQALQKLRHNSRTMERLYWQRWNWEFVKRIVAERHGRGIELMQAYPVRKVRALANRYGFQVVGNEPHEYDFYNY